MKFAFSWNRIQLQIIRGTGKRTFDSLGHFDENSSSFRISVPLKHTAVYTRFIQISVLCVGSGKDYICFAPARRASFISFLSGEEKGKEVSLSRYEAFIQ